MTDTKPIDKMTKPELVAALKAQGSGEGQPPYGWAHGLDYDAGIYDRLLGIASDMGAMEKQQVQNFKAFAVDDVYSKLRPLFTKWGVVILPSVRAVEYVMTERDGGAKSPAVDAHVEIDYRFVAPGGETATMTFAAEGRDFSDKATNKAVQQAFKYGLIQMFMISTGEVDPDADNPEIVQEGTNRVPANRAETVTADPKELLLKQVKDHAWILTANIEDKAYRIEEARMLVEQELAAYGRNPDDAADAQAIMSNMDAIFADDDKDADVS